MNQSVIVCGVVEGVHTSKAGEATDHVGMPGDGSLNEVQVSRADEVLSVRHLA